MRSPPASAGTRPTSFSSAAACRTAAARAATISSSSAIDGNNSPVTEALTERNRAAQALFAPLAPSYDRYARLLSFGQDPRWRSFLVSRIEARPEDTVLDVATGTGAVALELVRRYGCRVVGVDQSPEMLETAGRRTGTSRISLQQARAEELP